MASTEAPEYPRSRTTSAAASISACRVCACRWDRVSRGTVVFDRISDTVLYVKRRLQAAVVLAAMTFTAVNIPVGATVVGLWVASRLAGEGGTSMGAVGAFVVVAGGLGVALTHLLARLGRRHDRLVGREPSMRRQSPWMRPFNEQHHPGGSGEGQRALDVVMVLVVVAALLAYEGWVLFVSGLPFH